MDWELSFIIGNLTVKNPLFIKSLTLNGFKAFGDKTTVLFQEGIGALVGPNGSGKSNIIDAIKWVIGESKVSEIRGDKLEDLIFHGSVETQQQNMAEVELLISNDPAILPINYKEVSIIRRLYRSGATEFFINRNACRLKDIQDLFHNTGLGRGNYSVIPQGKIDQILSNKNNERRKLLEESSNLSFYQDKKKEYESQIAKTEENLRQVGIVIQQEERKKDQLAMQAKKSEEFLKLEEEKKQYQIGLLKHDLATFKNKEKNYIERLESIKIKNEDAEKELNKLRKEVSLNEKKVETQFKNLSDLEKSRIKINEQLSAIEKESHSVDNQLQETDRHLKHMEFNLSHHEEETRSITDKIKEQEKLFKNQEKEAVGIRKNITDAENAIKDKQTKLAETCDELDNTNAGISINRKNLKKLSGEVREIVSHLIDDIDQLKKKLDQEKIVDNRKLVVEKTRTIEKSLKEISKSQSKSNKLDVDAVNELIPLLKDYFSTFEKYFSIEDPFYRFFFSAEGTYSHKESIENRIQELEVETTDLENKVVELVNKKSENQQELLTNQNLLNQLNHTLKTLVQSNETIDREIKRLGEQIEKKKSYFEQTTDQIKSTKEQSKKLSLRKKEIEKSIKKYDSEVNTITKNIENYTSHQTSFTEKIKQLQRQINDLEGQNKNYEHQSQQLEIESAGTERDLKNLFEKALDQFSIDLHQHEAVLLEQPHQHREMVKSIHGKIRQLGPTNHLAKIEFDACVKNLDDIYEQRKDITDAMEDLQNLSGELAKKSEEQFLKTFEEVRKHFSNIINKLFVRGEGEVTLTNEADPLNSEIDIWVKPHGKKSQKLNLFSGGEKTLIAVAFMFSFFMTKPSPLCLLDEVDAALDSENIGRFLDLLKEIKNSTQFLLISHNQKTMQVFDYVYGISIRDGKTKILSLKL